MKIALSELKEISTLILTKAASFWIDEVIGYVNCYWTISLDDAYHLDRKEEVTHVGSIADDWYWLEKVLKRKNRSIDIDFDRLGNVITFVGYNNFFPDPNPVKPACLIKNVDVIKLCNHLITKTESVGFDVIDVTINKYRLFTHCDAIDFTKEPTEIVQSFEEDWQYLKNINSDSAITAKDFERLGRAFKVIRETINCSFFAHEELGINWTFSCYDDPEENLGD